MDDRSPHLITDLDEASCFERLAATALGRVAVSSGALPAIFPIHYVLLGRDPVFRTDPGTKLMAASSGQILCLEIDATDPVERTGWSVLVTGRAQILEDAEDLLAVSRLRLRPWTGSGDAYVRIEAALVSGRSVMPRPAPTPGGS